MSYVDRDVSRNITGIYANPQHDGHEFIDGAQIYVDPKEAISTAIQKLLDDKAKALRYDSILSARSYAGYVNPFQAEALKLADWAAACWSMAGVIETEVLAGSPIPTVDQVLLRMPIY